MDIPKPKRKRKAVRMAITLAVLIAAGGAATLGLRKLRAAAPSIDAQAVVIDSVRRGTMLREVQGQGTLVPEDIRWITANSTARVERVLSHPGDSVQEDTVLIEMSNPDVELAALEAERQVAAGQAKVAEMQAGLENQRLGQESSLGQLRAARDDATRRAKADQELADKGFLSKLELDQSKDRATELEGRVAFEQKRLGEIRKGATAQIDAQRSEVERLKSIAEFRHKQVDGLKVRAGVSGQLQELPLQAGQTVQQGALLAKVAKPGKLKAELRIPETQVKDVAIGQEAKVDTRNGVIPGKVSRIDPAAVNGTFKVDVVFVGELPPSARPDLTVEGTIELERLENVLWVGRPSFGEPGQTVKLFKLVAGDEALRIPVQFGKTSVKQVQILGGLVEGDRVILSDMSQWDAVDRVRLR